MGAGKVLAVGVVAFVAGVGAGWILASPDPQIAADQATKLATATKTADDAREAVTSLRSEVLRAHDEVTKQTARARELETKLADADAARVLAQAEVAKAPAPASADGVSAKRRARFSEPAFDAALATLDWDSVGEHFAAMPAPLAALLTALGEGKSPQDLPPETTEGLTKHNGPLVTVAVKLMQAKVPGTGANGAFTHPAFMSNAMAAALDDHGLPLTADQANRIQEITHRFVAEDQQRLGAYNDTTMQIRKIEEECLLRERFFVEARVVLTQEQRDALSPPAVRDRLQFDLFSSGVLLYTVTRGVKYESATQFAGEVAKSLQGALRLSDEQKAKFRDITLEWAAALPKDITTPTGDALDKLGVLHVHAALVSASQTRALVERAVNDLQLAGDSLTGARKWGAILMPLPTIAAADPE